MLLLAYHYPHKNARFYKLGLYKPLLKGSHHIKRNTYKVEYVCTHALAVLSTNLVYPNHVRIYSSLVTTWTCKCFNTCKSPTTCKSYKLAVHPTKRFVPDPPQKSHASSLQTSTSHETCSRSHASTQTSETSKKDRAERMHTHASRSHNQFRQVQ